MDITIDKGAIDKGVKDDTIKGIAKLNYFTEEREADIVGTHLTVRIGKNTS